MALFYAGIRRDSVSLFRFLFLWTCLGLLVRNLASLSFEISIQLFFPISFFTSFTFFLSFLMLPLLLLADLVSLSLFFLMDSLGPCIYASTQSSLLYILTVCIKVSSFFFHFFTNSFISTIYKRG